MAGPGKLTDAVPFGLAIAALYASDEPDAQAPDDASRRGSAPRNATSAGTRPGPAALAAFGVAAESLVARWTDNGHAPQAAEQCERAEAILSSSDLAGSPETGAGPGRTSAGCSKPGSTRGSARSATRSARRWPYRPGRRNSRGPAAKALDQVYEHGRHPGPRGGNPYGRGGPAADPLARVRRGTPGVAGRGRDADAPVVGVGRPGPDRPSPAPTPAGCRGLARHTRVCGTRLRPAAPGSTRRSRASWRPGHKGSVRPRWPAAGGKRARPGRPPAGAAAAPGRRGARRDDRRDWLRDRRGTHGRRHLAGSWPPPGRA